ncbi:glycosyltransferase family 2 protein [Mucilaginibacter mali]|uniref:Glycosyltransferase family 2 protein n=1 Tax=Mucilaginibacter mali TaxID=2740462 RepID=A0A7D4QJV4_9SPHI|nr:glycosyltransferase family 2 protein [Mucilaginibacter mali]QKJ29930.1 glycosyltransferase family 2 protein [Mucilaginibacter mali]
MVPVSVIIITKNEAEIISRTIAMARLITDDIVVIDNGSNDDTVEIAATNNCRIFKADWHGYGANKNKGIAHARYKWILSIDADEIIDKDLIHSLFRLDYSKENVVYDIRFKTYFGSKLIRFGSWGRDHHIRLFNRETVKWTELPVHETLVLPRSTVKKTLPGHIHHYSVRDEYECREKAIYYASLSAKKYYNSGKKSNYIKLYLAPAFNFIRNYFLYLGFLDGVEGWHIAKNSAKNTWLKYHYLENLECTDTKRHYVKHRLLLNWTE